MVGETPSLATKPDRATVELCIHILRGNLGAGRGSEALRQRDDDISILEALLTGAAEPTALAASMAMLQDFSDLGLLLDEIENWAAFSESVMLCFGELKRLRSVIAYVSADHMTSKAHHPAHVLIPIAAFEQLRAGMASAEAAGAQS